MKKLIFLLGLIMLGAFHEGVQAQDLDRLYDAIIKQQKQTRSEIESLNSQINTYEQNYKQANQRYENLYRNYKKQQHLIALRNERLKKLQDEQDQITQEIEVTTKSIHENEQKLQKLIENFKKTLRYVYMQGETSRAALLLTSDSMNQMLVRAYYLKKFNTFRDHQVEQIREAQTKLKEKKTQLEQAREKKGKVLDEIKKQKEELAAKKKEQEKNVAKLRQNKQQIQHQLQEVQQQKRQLNSTLDGLVKREKKIREAQKEAQRRKEQKRKKNLAEAKKIKNDKKRAEEVAKYKAPVENVSSLNFDKIEQQFSQEKGHLPWPVTSRTVSEHFGRHRNPVYGTVTPSLGIEIVTDARSPVSVVQRGEVIAIRPIPGFGEVVIVKHGRYLTLYGNLSKVSVRTNQVLQQGDRVGLSGDQNSANGKSLFFLIRKDNDNLDPEQWLRPVSVSSR